MVKRYTYRYADDGDLYRHEEPDGKYVLYSDYAALEARLAEVEREWDEAIENGMAVSASCCPWVNKGGLYAGPDGYPGCGVKDRLAEVEAQRDGLKITLDIIQSGFEYRNGDPKMDGTFERFPHVLNRSRMMDIAREGLAKLEEK